MKHAAAASKSNGGKAASKPRRQLRTVQVLIRVTPAEKQLMEECWQADQEPNLSTWLRRLALQRAKRISSVDRASE